MEIDETQADAVALGREMREHRENAGMSQDTVAKRVDWSSSRLSRIENGKAALNKADLEILFRVYDVPEPDQRRLTEAWRSSRALRTASRIRDISPASTYSSIPPELSPSSVGQVLRDVRRSRQLTQDQLANRLLWSASKVSRIENGKSRPSLRDIRELSDLLSLDTETATKILDALNSNVSNFVPKVSGERESSEDSLNSPILIPGFASDMPTGRDLLGIEDDARALSTLLCSTTLQPPLALGLYGDWGAGKTFFMKMLERNISKLERDSQDASDSELPFCKNVVNVWFSAWHYAEGNLWASLVRQIFVSLHGVQPTPRRLLDEALAEVEGIKQARFAAEAGVALAHQDSARAQTDLDRFAQEHEDARTQISRLSASDVWDVISADAEDVEKFNEAAATVGLPPAGTGAREVAEAVEASYEVIKTGRFLLATAGRWKSPLIVSLCIALPISACGILAAAGVSWAHAWVAPTLASVAQVAAACSGAAAWVSRQASLTRQLLEPAERLKRQLQQRQAEAETEQREQTLAAQGRLENALGELETARMVLTAAQEREAEARLQIGELTGSRLLDRYLSERIRSQDYSRYLGAVALAHRDLRDLDAYLSAASTEEGSPVERIILYIDDLDRCAPATVVKVLEAVHLLLALPLFVVVVGVDARWLARSLNAQHALFLGSGDGQAESESPYRRPSPADYLDKIFQLSYTLPEMSAERCAELLVASAVETQPTIVDSAATSNGAVDLGGAPQAARATSLETGDRGDVGESGDAFDTRLAAAALVLDVRELRLLEAVAPLVGTSPRRAKRFLNICRVIKARALADPRLQQRLAEDGPAGLVVLTALAVGLPRAVSDKVAAADPDDTIRSWVDRIVNEVDDTDAKRIRAFLSASRDDLGPTPVAKLLQWIPVARPYAWPPAAG